MDHVETEAADPFDEAGKSSPVWQVGAQGCGARSHCDFAIIELGPQRGARLTCERDLICV
jgi:hypothetical protein